jgi:hypothetical protein
VGEGSISRSRPAQRAERGMGEVISEYRAARACRASTVRGGLAGARRADAGDRAEQKVAQLGRDPRLVDVLAAVCSRGAVGVVDSERPPSSSSSVAAG